MSLLSTIKFRTLDLPMLKKSLMHDEWWGFWYCEFVNLWTCGLSVFSQKVDRKKASGRWCQLASRMQNVFTFASKQNYAEHKFTLLELTMKPHVCNFWIEAAPKLSMILELLDLFWGGLPNRDLGLNMLEPSWTTCQHDEFIINHQIQNAWLADVEKISDAWWMVGL